MTLFTKLDDKKKIPRSAEKSKAFSSVTMNGNVLEPFVISYRYVKLLIVYFRNIIDNLHSLPMLHSKPFPQ
jgi:hypothetical protein